ncbi:hypothetical protein CVU37_13530 [candidate division BRC1 bacterium HGW-BRC1-1]|jgi:DNA-binding response OmpR family regulator|nr:MAG: hypothetical protein CVU37_13530 [candidate division BRC1 bacterium HGW-BRC1-1]
MQKRRILIVDDEEDIRSLIRSALTTNYDVVEAQDGLDALSKLDLVEPDFVILDVMMPLMDGVEACNAIRRHPRYQDISVMFLSALKSKEDLKRGYGAGANLYLTKPFEPARLVRNVDLFFETDPPPLQRKRYTVDEIRLMEEQGPQAVAAAQAGTTKQVTVTRSLPAATTPTKAVPAAASAPTRAPAPAPVAAPAPQFKTRVLAIDDDPDILTIIRGYLGNDYEFVMASNGLEAVERITSLQPDIILLDAMLPKMSGYQLCQSLRRNARYAGTPILFISAKCQPRDREYAMRVGASDFLAKPFTPEELHAHLKKMKRLPGFAVHVKTLSIEQIDDLEKMRHSEQEAREKASQPVEETELNKFIRENR